MSQIPPPGAIGRQTFINDHLIEDLSVEVIDSETGKFYFNEQHLYVPSVIVVKYMAPSAPHINFYMTGVTNAGNFATGSITIQPGVTGIDLNGDSFFLEDKDGENKLFTFDSSTNDTTNGNIGISDFSGGTAPDVLGISGRISDSVNNEVSLKIRGISGLADPLNPGGAIATLGQEITGSTGNTIIDVSGVTGTDSVDFENGTSYGSGSFAASETFSGNLLIRAASLQIEYL